MSDLEWTAIGYFLISIIIFVHLAAIMRIWNRFLHLPVTLRTRQHCLLVHLVLGEGISYALAMPMSREPVLHLPVTQPRRDKPHHDESQQQQSTERHDMPAVGNRATDHHADNLVDDRRVGNRVPNAPERPVDDMTEMFCHMRLSLAEMANTV